MSADGNHPNQATAVEDGRLFDAVISFLACGKPLRISVALEPHTPQEAATTANPEALSLSPFLRGSVPASFFDLALRLSCITPFATV